MTQDRWVKVALTDESLVANILLRMKHSSDTDSLHALSQPHRSEAVITKALPPRWGNRKNRSKSTAPVTSGKEQRGSPTTHLSWSGGGSTSDESSRSGFRSVKSNEVASTSGYNNKSHKRKAFFELKDEEGSLINQRMHINKVSLNNQELTSMRVNLNQQMTTSQNLKKVKISYGQNPINKTTSCRVEVEAERGFVLPDLNMTPNDEDSVMMMMMPS